MRQLEYRNLIPTSTYIEVGIKDNILEFEDTVEKFLQQFPDRRDTPISLSDIYNYYTELNCSFTTRALFFLILILAIVAGWYFLF